MSETSRVLILGAGINGVAVARELALNGVASCIVDEHDIAFGATSKSSRLIHGGLRYLEYADFQLVRESLQERNRLATNAPQFIRPLKLHIPVSSRFSGFFNAFSRFCNLSRLPGLKGISRWMEQSPDRGLYVVRTGLKFYDSFAASRRFPAHEVHRAGDPALPPVDPSEFKWICSYYDGQMWAVERFVLAMLEDTRQLLVEQQLPFTVYPHHQVELQEGKIRVLNQQRECVDTFEPAVIINATGAWGDLTLSGLEIKTDRLFRGTKGSHFFTKNRQLKAAVGEDGLYAEAADGRPVFILPVGPSIMVGTTDVPVEGSPTTALATADELDYLLRLTNTLFPHIELTPSEIDFFYCGVRPLPYVDANSTSAVSRGHSIHEQQVPGVAGSNLPVLTLIGGKLTTCRALAEDVTRKVGETIAMENIRNSRDRLYPGAEDYPETSQLLEERQQELANEYGLSVEQIKTLWELYGTRIATILKECRADGANLGETVPGCPFPTAVVRWILQHEWVPNLEALVNRRLLLLYESPLKRETVTALAELMVDAALLPADDVTSQVDSLVQTMSENYGKQVY